MLGIISSYRIIGVPIVFALCTIGLYIIVQLSPGLSKLSDSQGTPLAFPTNMEELRSLVSLLSLYRETHYYYVILLFSCGYIYKQMFGIPGSSLLNLLAGAIFGVPVGVPLVCLLTVFGATGCYFLSYLFGKQYVEYYFPNQIRMAREKIETNMDRLFFLLLFSRLMPMTPNWLLNIMSPIVHVPVHYFMPSVFIGLMPYNFICVQAGSILSEISSINDLFTWETLLKLFVIAVVALMPTLLMKRVDIRDNAHRN